MKRYTCPRCGEQYHIEPAECPCCLWGVGTDGPMLDAAPRTTITISDGVAWFEDGSDIYATPELLKAAPQMLAALELLVAAANAESNMATYLAHIGRARAAIAAARGES